MTAKSADADSTATNSVKADAEGQSLDPVESIASAWQTTTIKVPGGGKRPDLLTLMKAFNATWNMEAFNAIPMLEKNKKRAYQSDLNSGGSYVIDLASGYLTVEPGDTDTDRLNAALWRRKNGHTLLGVCTYTNPNYKDAARVICFFDYDPATETMKPEVDNAVLNCPVNASCNVPWSLPTVSQDVVVKTNSDSDADDRWTVFYWDGQKFVKGHSYSGDMLRSALPSTWVNVQSENYEGMPLTFEADEGLNLSNCGIYGSTEYDAELFIVNGRAVVQSSYSDDEEEAAEYDPDIIAEFTLTSAGQLRGGYSLRQPGDRESRGQMTLGVRTLN